MTPSEVAAYLRRLGLPADMGPPSVPGLLAIHAAQVERVPYEVLDIQIGRPPSIEPSSSVARVLRGRGGYCYNMNGALSSLLTALGFDVRWHRGGVHNAGEEPGSAPANHLALTVHGLPAPQCPSGVWFADAGLGDGLHLPLPLAAGTYVQGPYTFGLVETGSGWQFRHDPAGSFAWMDFDYPGTAVLADFQERHEYLSTSPSSGFVRTCAIARRDPAGADVLTGCVLERRGSGAGKRVVDDRASWFAVLGDVFGLRLDDLSDSDKDRLWNRVQAAHVSWLSQQ